MNEAYKRLTHRTLNAAKRRKSSGAKLNSSLKGRKSSSVNCAAYERYTYKTKRPALGVKTAEEIRAVLSAYISIQVLITNVTNIGGDIMVNYRILDDNIDRELAQNEIIAGLDYIEAIEDDTDYNALNGAAKSVVDNSDKDVADYAAESYKQYKLINRDFKNPVAVNFSVADSTGDYSGYVIALDDNRNYVLENIEGTIPEGVEPIQEVLNDYKELTGTAKFDECDEKSFNTKAQAIRELADAEKTVRETNEQIANAEAFKEEYGEYPDEWDPLTALFNSEIEGLGD